MGAFAVNQSNAYYNAGVAAHCRLQNDAIALLLKAQKANPNDLRTAIVLYELYDGTGNHGMASRFYELINSLIPDASSDEIEFFEAVMLLDSPNPEEAADILSDYLRRNPGETFIWTVAARHFGNGSVLQGRQRYLKLCDLMILGSEPPDIQASRKAFFLHETNDLRNAEIFAHKALSLEPKNGSATHSLLHIFYTELRHTEGLKIATSWLNDVGIDSPMRSHIGWHAAIHALSLKDFQRAKSILKNTVLNPPTRRGITVDGPALAWQLHIRGEMIWEGLEWFKEALQSLDYKKLTPLSSAFVAFGLAALGDHAILVDLISYFTAQKNKRFDISVIIGKGLLAWVDNDWIAAEKWFKLAKEDIWCIGGSHIQQAIIESTYKEILSRSYG